MFSGFFSRSCGGSDANVRLEDERLEMAGEAKEDDVEGLVWFENNTSDICLKKLFETDSKRAVGAGTKIKIPPGRLEILEPRLISHGRLAKMVAQDSWSLFRALAFALGRRREASHVNIRSELVEQLRVMGDWPVLSPDAFHKKYGNSDDVTHEMNLVKTMFIKPGWPQYVNHLAVSNSPGDEIMLLAACCVYKTKICLLTATPNNNEMSYDDPIWLAAPEHWRTCDIHEPWSVPTERSPIYIAHVHGCQFFAVETRAQNSRNKNRQVKLDQSRRIVAETADRKAAEIGELEDENSLPTEETDEDRLKVELSNVLLPVRQLGELEPTEEQILLNEKVFDMVKRLDGDELFELLFEYKSIFDVFDYDSSGVMAIDEVVRAFRSYDVDLRQEGELTEGGFGVNKESLGNLRRVLGGHPITFTHFAKNMLADRKDTSPSEDLKLLLSELKPEIDPEHGDRRVKIEDVDKVLANFNMSIFDALSIDPDMMKKDDGHRWIKVADIEAALAGPQDQ